MEDISLEKTYQNKHSSCHIIKFSITCEELGSQEMLTYKEVFFLHFTHLLYYGRLRLPYASSSMNWVNLVRSEMAFSERYFMNKEVCQHLYKVSLQPVSFYCF